MKYVTTLDRFSTGDFPMVCVRSGKPATKMVRVQAYRKSAWRWYSVPGLDYLLSKWFGDSHYPWGRLPFADGHVGGISATYNRRAGVTVRGAHRDFVAASKQAGRRRWGQNE